ncbi:MAG: hypothetical protein ACRCZ9_12390 [Fusobacteriaceae bacterium]
MNNNVIPGSLNILDHDGVIEVALLAIDSRTNNNHPTNLGDLYIGKISIHKIYLNTLIYNTLPTNMKNDVNFIYLKDGLEIERNKYLNRITDHLFDFYKYDRNKTNWILGQIADAMVKFVRSFDLKLTESLSMKDFTNLARSSERMMMLLTSPNFDDNMSIYEINDAKDSLTQEIKSYVLDKKFEPFYSLLGAGAGLRIPQLSDTILSRGIRPDYHFPNKGEDINTKNEIIPHCIKESWINGTQDRMTFFIENSIARNALVIVKLKVSDPSVLGKCMSLSSARNYISHTEKKCNSIATRPILIKNENDLYRVHGRNMVDQMGQIVPVYKTMKELIGKTIHLRSPAFCNCKDGICEACAGWMFVEDFRENVSKGRRNLGAIISKSVSAPAGQSYLSLKHAQTPRPIKLLMEIVCSNIGKAIDNSKIVFRNLNVVDLKLYDPIRLYVKNYKTSEKDIFTSRIYFEQKDGSEKYVELHGSNFYFKSEFLMDDGTIVGTDIRFVTKNSSVQQLYLVLLNLLGKPSNRPVIESINELDANLQDNNTIAAEVIFRGLIYDTLSDGPADFSNPNINIGTRSLEKSIKEGDSLVPKLFLGNLKEILTQVENFDRNKLQTSIYDELFEYRS